MLRASNGKEYGPVTLVQVVAWVHEGRVGEFTELRRSDMQHWAQARDFVELKFLFAGGEQSTNAGAPGIISPPPVAQENLAAVSQMKSGASWFYWIAGLSVVNSTLALTGKGWHFIFALGITQIIDSFGPEADMLGKLFVFTASLLIAVTVSLFGFFGAKRQTWAFIVGMSIYALDGLLLLLASRWLDAALHGVVLFFIFRGLQACRALRS